MYQSDSSTVYRLRWYPVSIHMLILLAGEGVPFSCHGAMRNRTRDLPKTRIFDSRPWTERRKGDYRPTLENNFLSYPLDCNGLEWAHGTVQAPAARYAPLSFLITVNLTVKCRGGHSSQWRLAFYSAQQGLQVGRNTRVLIENFQCQVLLDVATKKNLGVIDLLRS